MKFVFVILIICFKSTFGKDEFKLLESVLPEYYNLTLQAQLEDEFKFQGTIQILVKCFKRTSTIILHCKNLKINEVKVRMMKPTTFGTSVDVRGTVTDEKHDFLFIKLKEDLKVRKKYFVDIKFEGKMNDDPWGFYKMQFTDKNGTLHSIASTHFEPIMSRMAFPCFDEPAMKATFEITIGRKKKHKVLSNMPLVRTAAIIGKEGWYWDYFMKTPLLSSYLVAFVILDDGIGKIPAGNIDIWIRKDELGSTQRTQYLAPRLMTFFEKYFGIEYSLPKMDFFSAPMYPPWASADEMWGLVSFKEKKLSQDGPRDLFNYRKETIISHELAHQWFGNLITMECWGQLWLKESLATYFSSIANDYISGGQTFEYDFSTNYVTIMQDFAGQNTLSRECPWDFDNIKKIYDKISYKKGGFIIRMAQIFFGMKDLRKTSNHLLMKHKFGSITQNDLWSAFKETAPRNIFSSELSFETVIESWTNQAGFPLIEVVRDYKNGTAFLHQNESYNIFSSFSEHPCWWIPVSYATKSDQAQIIEPRIWLTCPTQSARIEGLKESEWLLLNVQVSGLYMVFYDEQNWKLLSDDLKNKGKFQRIPLFNRFQLILDRITSTLHGHGSHEALLDMLIYLKHERKYSPWKAASGYFNRIKYWIMKSNDTELKDYMHNIIKPFFLENKLNIHYKNVAKMSFQILIIKVAASFKLPECIYELNVLFKQFRRAPIDKNPIPSILRNTVYCTVVETGSESDFNILLIKYLESEKILDLTERKKMYFSLFCTPNASLQKKLERILKPVGRTVDFTNQFFEGEGIPPVINDLILPEIYRRLETMDIHLAVKWLSQLVGSLHNEKDLIDFVTLTKKIHKRMHMYKADINGYVKAIRKNIEWKNKYSEEIKKVLPKILSRQNPTHKISEKRKIQRSEATNKVPKVLALKLLYIFLLFLYVVESFVIWI